MLSADGRRSVNWLEMNMWLSAFAFKQGKGRNAIVIDPSFIKKAGKHTHTWVRSGRAVQVR
ncbi:Uncharacterised protein [Prevotella nigrescens]|nr:Uncharacterised protein [Prevotella nigrescens]